MNNSIQDDIDLLLNSDDTDDEELRLEGLRDKITKESFLSMVENATVGADLLPIIELLPNSSQRYGHSITMNAIIKIIARHAVFKDRAAVFYTMKNGVCHQALRSGSADAVSLHHQWAVRIHHRGQQKY